MRELQTCDFCGADAVGTFEIVPSELDPSEAEQRRVVLCGGCKTTLEDLVEPLLARANAGNETGSVGDSESRNDETNDPLGSSAGDSTIEFSEDERNEIDRDDHEDAVRFPSAESTDVPDEAPDTDSNGPAEDPDAPTDESNQATDESNASTGDSNTPTDDSSATDSDDDAADGRSQAPPAYGKVIRLLSNREFPMERDAVEELAAGAYDLSERESRKIVDHAVERGEFVEDGDQLRRS